MTRKCVKWSMAAVILLILSVWIIPVKTQAASWNKDEVYSVTQGAFTYEAYLSEDGTESWIYEVKIGTEGNREVLRFPDKIEGAKVTKLGAINRPDWDVYVNIFHEGVEWYHNMDGYQESMKHIKKVVIPDTVDTITITAFSGLRNLETVKLLKNLKRLKEFTFHNCKKLKQVTIPQNTIYVSVRAFEKCKNLSSIKVCYPKGSDSKHTGYCGQHQCECTLWLCGSKNQDTEVCRENGNGCING